MSSSWPSVSPQSGLPEPRGAAGTSCAASAAGRGAVGFHISPVGRLKLFHHWRWRWVMGGICRVCTYIYIYNYILKETNK